MSGFIFFLVSCSDIHMPTCINSMHKFPDGNKNFWFHVFVRWSFFTSKQVGNEYYYISTCNIQVFWNLKPFQIQLESYLLLFLNENILWDLINKAKHLLYKNIDIAEKIYRYVKETCCMTFWSVFNHVG